MLLTPTAIRLKESVISANRRVTMTFLGPSLQVTGNNFYMVPVTSPYLRLTLSIGEVNSCFFQGRYCEVRIL